jgi:hypothetical protein
MAEIGHNGPPPHEAWALHIEELFEVANSIGEATNDEQEAALDDLLDQFRKAKRDADKERAAEKKPHDDAAKAVQAKWKPLLDRCDIAAKAIKDALTPYRTAKQRAADEAARKAREQAEAAHKAAQEAFKSKDLDDRLEAERLASQAKAMQVQANKIDRQSTGLRTTWVAEIADRKLALLHYIKVQPEAFEALIQSLADKDARNEATRRDIPGVKFHEKKEAF